MALTRNELLTFLTRQNKSNDFNRLHGALSRHHAHIVTSLHSTHKHAKKLAKKHKVSIGHMRHGGSKALAGAALATSLFVAPAFTAPEKPTVAAHEVKTEIPPPPSESLRGPDNPNYHHMSQAEFGEAIHAIMQNSARDGKLSDAQFQEIQKLLEQQMGVNVGKANDKGFELNKHYGYLGSEQHLPTKPGDNAHNHINKFDPTAVASGITPGRGAWGYVPSMDEERWYVVGQTFLSDQFGTPATKGLGGQRYIVIQIPEEMNGQHTSVIRGGIWDAGPGASTGKVFGGSPEFFHQFGPKAGRTRKTKVIMLPEMGERKPASELGPLNSKFKSD